MKNKKSVKKKFGKKHYDKLEIHVNVELTVNNHGNHGYRREYKNVLKCKINRTHQNWGWEFRKKGSISAPISLFLEHGVNTVKIWNKVSFKMIPTFF